MNSWPPTGPVDMTNELQISRRPAVPYLGMRRRVTDGIAAAVDGAFPELFRRLGQAGVQPAGPPFIRFLAVDDDGERTELGARLARPRRRRHRRAPGRPLRDLGARRALPARHRARPGG